MNELNEGEVNNILRVVGVFDFHFWFCWVMFTNVKVVTLFIHLFPFELKGARHFHIVPKMGIEVLFIR